MGAGVGGGGGAEAGGSTRSVAVVGFVTPRVKSTSWSRSRFVLSSSETVSDLGRGVAEERCEGRGEVDGEGEGWDWGWGSEEDGEVGG